MSGFLSSPQSADPLPTISPSPATWTPQELQTLHTGLNTFPIDQFDNVTRYIKIAATLPRKCVRDVAYKVKALGYTGGPTTTTKRMKIERYKDPNIPSAELEEARLVALLQDNMMRFRANCDTVLTALGAICTSIPPLPLQLDTSLLENEQDKSDNSS
ncbi:hypothetical protein L915_06761 [Plasmopara halstedii]|uniref:Homeodomain-like n=1 Tax=Plasmopara halstedii TaxID=4781 RepID=A0A0P1A6X8_PLAHL|nr:hypothetical protein L915_06761 [Plasmopara halstedii]CEG35993.1 hypothetical protein L915_06761 [Plasmopara halstedii]|eukprot:XP_024572362.1 hypothetical protein L915_06761 [Plasmopara halstedii]